MVSLYLNGEVSGGRKSPYVPLSCICSITVRLIFSYSSFVYCLFKMQYRAFFKPMHPKQFSQLFKPSQYSTPLQYNTYVENLQSYVCKAPMISRHFSGLKYI